MFISHKSRFCPQSPNPAPSPWPRLTGWIEVIPAPFLSRFKYVLVNMSSGLVQDQTLWSDPIRTDQRKWWAPGGPEVVLKGTWASRLKPSLRKFSPDTGRSLD